MNKMAEVAKLFDLAIDEEFDVIDDGGEELDFNPYKFTLEGMEDCDGDEAWDIIGQIFKGNYKVVKRPFKPKDGEEYFLINCVGNVSCQNFTNHYLDLLLIHMGNCFGTEQEAEKHKDEILTKFNEIKEGLR